MKNTISSLKQRFSVKKVFSAAMAALLAVTIAWPVGATSYA